MEQWVWLAGIVIVLMVLWLLWSLTRNSADAPLKPDLDMPRPVPRPVEPVPTVEEAAPVEEVAPPEEPAPPAPPKADGPPDDLRLIKGVGPKLNTLLGQLGVSRFDQIAAFGEEDIARLDAQLGTFAGRIQRDNWVEQAGYLARGDTAGFEAKFGALGG